MIDCATIEVIGEKAKGWKASCGTYYSMDYAIEHNQDEIYRDR